MKRLVVGGMDRVYKINRNFRNEGISTQHNPEFTMLEFYEAYSDYRVFMDLTEALLSQIASAVTGGTAVQYGEHTIDFAKWDRLTMRDAIVRHWPAAAGSAPSTESLKSAGGPRETANRFNAWAKQGNAEPIAKVETLGDGELVGALFESVAEPFLVQPTILYDFPVEISPLSKCKDDDPSTAERFEVFIGGFSLATLSASSMIPLGRNAASDCKLSRAGKKLQRKLISTTCGR